MDANDAVVTSGAKEEDQARVYTFEDMAVGQHYNCGTHQVSREDILEFAKKFDPQPFHMDEAAAAKSMYGGLIASGWHTCAMAMRCMCDHFLNNATGVGSPGFDEIRFVRPVRPGDVLEVSLEVLEVTPSRSKPDRGAIKTKTYIMNQKGELAATIVATTLMRRREALE